jgi:hypothetical protein
VRHVVIIAKISISVKNNSKYTTGISGLNFINLRTWRLTLQAKLRSYGNTGPHQSANRSYFSSLLLMKCHGTRWRIRVILHQMLIHSILLYDSATWTLSHKVINIQNHEGKGRNEELDTMRRNTEC